jgi:hypothetical protein
MPVTTELLGLKARDRITGFNGTITGFVTYISGCNQALITPSLAPDGALREPMWIDEQRLIVDRGPERIVLDNRRAPGFDKQAPKR